ncbi:hypothetical protein VNI00_016509 [Paramarasmius palmivorus]|uniref:Uncharacterized protein n=1 Tax=Paramarasmius palmivorus TaxID=297713 RepID=A0AAW0BEJ0_9AGAR
MKSAASSNPLSTLHDFNNQASKKRRRNSLGMEESSRKRQAATTSREWLQDHYSTSFEDSQVQSQEWFAEEFPDSQSNVASSKSSPSIQAVTKENSLKADVKKEEVQSHRDDPRMKLIDDETKETLELQSKLNRAEATIDILRQQLARAEKDGESIRERSYTEIAKLELKLVDVGADKRIAEAMRDQRTKEVLEVTKRRRQIEKERDSTVAEANRRVRQAENERDTARTERDIVRNELASLKEKLNQLVSL